MRTPSRTWVNKGVLRLRSGQAMIETLLAVLVIVFSFFVLFELSRLLTAKILVEHAAFQVARARSVGLNRFMCLKTARFAMIPVSGRRLRPEGDPLNDNEELARKKAYFRTATYARSCGVLDYERWPDLSVDPSDGTDAKVSFEVPVFDGWMSFTVTGTAGVERNASFYMLDSGL